MRITIDASKLPEGTSVQDVYDTILSAMGSFIGDQERPGLNFDQEKAVMRALVSPKNPEPLCTADRAYLRKVAKGRHGVNNWQAGWGADDPVRRKLQSLGLVEVRSYKACGMGDVDTTACTLTSEGRRALKP